jgi:molecular chaperone DnaK (HSP70)
LHTICSQNCKKDNPEWLTKEVNMSVVGIDFGLQHSVIAAAGRGGVDVILNGNSNRLNP